MSPNEKQIKNLLERQETYSDCLDLLLTAVNDYAKSVGVEGFSLGASYSRTEHAVCFLSDDFERTLDAENEQAVAMFLGMIAQAKATPKKGQ